MMNNLEPGDGEDRPGKEDVQCCLSLSLSLFLVVAIRCTAVAALRVALCPAKENDTEFSSSYGSDNNEADLLTPHPSSTVW